MCLSHQQGVTCLDNYTTKPYEDSEDAEAYGKEAITKFDGKTYISPPLVDNGEVFAEWTISK